MRIDQVMLRGMVSQHELGIYSAALPISTALVVHSDGDFRKCRTHDRTPKAE